MRLIKFFGRWGLCFVALIVSLPLYADELSTQLAAFVDQSRQFWNVPGVAVGVIRDGRVVFLGAVGKRQLDSPEPVTPDTVYPIGSCTKAFTAALWASLVDDGKAQWDDLVRQHLPDFRLADPLANREVTLRDLLTHRSGLASHDLLWYRGPFRGVELVKRVGYLPLDQPFRTSFQYQTIMYMALGQALEKPSGLTWEKLIRLRLLAPLGIDSAPLTTSEFRQINDRASGHYMTANGQLLTIPNFDFDEPNPAGSLHLSVRQALKWLQFHLDEGRIDARVLISAKQLRETRTPQFVIPLSSSTARLHPYTHLMSYGMGWVVHDHRGQLVVAHSGIIDGFRAQLTLVPKEKIGIAVFANSHATRLNLAVTNGILDRLLGLTPKDWDRIIRQAVAEEQAQNREREQAQERLRFPSIPASQPVDRWAGTYTHPVYGSIEISKKSHLNWGKRSYTLRHWNADIYTISDEPILGKSFVEFIGKQVRAWGVTFHKQEK